ncbi:hypothetical protein EJ04DRAFT_577110 [Polyplosphaeria fusca]|uniref:Uncharacterized protein n=1 Tax=Polyplosphaeria fusca TaxID=682080 RepID=A0A9P4R0E2_9PLEO|nr:hypothetical protein EJ04DRAFT_577110 [Polyplosphaeria fusca]
MSRLNPSAPSFTPSSSPPASWHSIPSDRDVQGSRRTRPQFSNNPRGQNDRSDTRPWGSPSSSIPSREQSGKSVRSGHTVTKTPQGWQSSPLNPVPLGALIYAPLQSFGNTAPAPYYYWFSYQWLCYDWARHQYYYYDQQRKQWCQYAPPSLSPSNAPVASPSSTEYPASISSYSLHSNGSSYFPAAVSSHNHDSSGPNCSPATIEQTLSWASPSPTPSYRSEAMFDIAKLMTLEKGYRLLRSRRINIVNDTTKEVYVRAVSKQMLIHFCGTYHIFKYLKNVRNTRQILQLPNGLVEQRGLQHVVDYMQKCCLDVLAQEGLDDYLWSKSVQERIETVRACKVLGLWEDAKLVEEQTVLRMGTGCPTWKDVEFVWQGYSKQLRDSAFVDAIAYALLDKDLYRAPNVSRLLNEAEYKPLLDRLKRDRAWALRHGVMSFEKYMRKARNKRAWYAQSRSSSESS